MNRGKILFVDDDQTFLEWGKITLEKLGYEVTAASNGVEALEIFSSDPSHFDLVITDITMPEMNGLQLASKLCSMRKDIPIIFCTGYNKAVSAERAYEIADECLMKPITGKELADAVTRVLDTRMSNHRQTMTYDVLE